MRALREDVANALILLGYKVSRKWQLAIRDERTPSAFINNNGTIHDFGSGWHGDLADFLKDFHGFSIGEAMREARKLLKQENHFDFSNFEKSYEATKKKEITETILERYLSNRKIYFKAYKKLLDKLLISVKSFEKKKKIAIKYNIGYQPGGTFNGVHYEERLIMPIRNEEGKILTLWKYNPFLESNKKLRYSKGRERYPFNIKDLVNHQKEDLICILEGEKDVLNAVAHGIPAITPGSATSLFKKEQLPLFDGLKVLIVGDYDQAGKRFNSAIKEQIEPYAKNVKLLDWEKFLKTKPKKGFDLTDYLSRKKEMHHDCLQNNKN
ncbi:hypothetical protein CQA54_08650 [Helicobacter equorum]|uniref:Toprim domain-containing protein n=1 Tax=Helicobacter equorum TaxID=361872 RepID=A0A3D8ILA5_9HELI|nr:hypothetical protein CQA54_08650 [Helicobacter equorum]